MGSGLPEWGGSTRTGLADGEPAWIEELGRDPNFPRLKIAHACGLASAFAFPLRIDRTLFGVLEFFRPAPTPVDAALLRLMASVGSHLGHRPTRRHGGLGLGLSIVHQLVQRHGGTVRADSEGPGKGARFTVTFPAAPGDPPSGGAHVPAGSARILAGVSVLVVEDDDDARDVLAAAIALADADVTTASDAKEALALRGTKELDFVVTDLGMPEIDGYELLARWRESGERIPIIAVTAFASSDDERRAINAGFDGFIPKPVKADDLVARIEAVLAAERTRVLKPRA